MGNALIQFVVNLIALLSAGAIFFLTIDRVAPDAFFAKIAKIAIGALLLIALVLSIAAVFGMASGVRVAPLGVVWFAIAVIVAIAILYIINLIIDWVAANMGGGPWVTPIKYVLAVIVLVGLLVVAANVLFGVGYNDMRRGSLAAPPFRVAGGSPSTLPTGAAAGL